ncbi:MAG TPA: hypothetical protein VFY76_16985 [Nocardioides sp.]|nr:hypothetical protein [Nocardioides sp.]
MKLFRRRARATSKADALAEARRATARVRRQQEEVERYRARKQADPADRMTTNQWIGSGGT